MVLVVTQTQTPPGNKKKDQDNSAKNYFSKVVKKKEENQKKKKRDLGENEGIEVISSSENEGNERKKEKKRTRKNTKNGKLKQRKKQKKTNQEYNDYNINNNNNKEMEKQEGTSFTDFLGHKLSSLNKEIEKSPRKRNSINIQQKWDYTVNDGVDQRCQEKRMGYSLRSSSNSLSQNDHSDGPVNCNSNIDLKKDNDCRRFRDGVVNTNGGVKTPAGSVNKLGNDSVHDDVVNLVESAPIRSTFSLAQWNLDKQRQIMTRGRKRKKRRLKRDPSGGEKMSGRKGFPIPFVSTPNLPRPTLPTPITEIDDVVVFSDSSSPRCSRRQSQTRTNSAIIMIRDQRVLKPLKSSKGMLSASPQKSPGIKSRQQEGMPELCLEFHEDENEDALLESPFKKKSTDLPHEDDDMVYIGESEHTVSKKRKRGDLFREPSPSPPWFQDEKDSHSPLIEDVPFIEDAPLIEDSGKPHSKLAQYVGGKLATNSQDELFTPSPNLTVDTSSISSSDEYHMSPTIFDSSVRTSPQADSSPLRVYGKRNRQHTLSPFPAEDTNDSVLDFSFQDRGHQTSEFPPILRRSQRLKQKVVPQSNELQLVIISSDEESPQRVKQRRDQLILNYNGIRILQDDLLMLRPREFINDTIIDFYLQYIWQKVDPNRNKYHVFSSFFFKRLRGGYESVKSWTKEVNIFNCESVFIPINQNFHWRLAIILMNVSGAPNILIFDSLPGSEGTARKVLQNYIIREWKNKHNDQDPPWSKVPCRTPRVPQQDNSTDCGIFLLHYSELFMRNPNPNLLKSDWFDTSEISQKRTHIKRIIDEELRHDSEL